MRKIYFLLSLFVVSVPAATWAQKQDDFDLHVASLRVLQRRDVQADMRVTLAQRGRMDKFAEAYDAEMNAYLKELQKQGKQDERMPDQTMQMMLARLKQNVMSVLNAAQLKRLREISLQVYALNGLLDETIGTKIGLTRDQMNRIEKRYEDGSKQANDIMANAMKPVNQQFKNAKPKDQKEADTLKKAYTDKSQAAMAAVMPNVQSVRAATQDDILKIITPAQKSDYLSLQGKPFTPTKTGAAPSSAKQKGKAAKTSKPKGKKS